MWIWIWIAAIGAALGLGLTWLAKSLKIIGPGEMAVKVIFGKPVDFCDSGWVFDLRLPFGRRFECFLQQYPKKMYNFDYRAQEVITAAGKYEGIPYSDIVLRVDAVVYLNFPRKPRGEATGDVLPADVEMEEVEGKRVESTHPLVKILRAHVPVDDDKLKDWTEEAVLGALRVAFGKMTWKQAVKDIKKVTKEAFEVFTSADGALIGAGFSRKGIRLVVTEITLPPSLQQAMPAVDRQRLEAKAAQFKAEQTAVELIGTVIEMMARSRGKTPEEIRAEIDQSPELKEEFRSLARELVVRQMAIDGGSYLDIRVQGAEGLERMFLNALAARQRMPPGGKSGKERARITITKEDVERARKKL